MTVGATPGKRLPDHDRIVEAALSTGVDAIHPGYGLARTQVVEAVGQAFGSWPHRTPFASWAPSSRPRSCSGCNIPMVPGTSAVSDPAEAKREAERIGFPLDRPVPAAEARACVPCDMPSWKANSSVPFRG